MYVANVCVVLAQRTTGWRYQKRPGVDALLVQLFDLYEIVIFTTDQSYVSLAPLCHDNA